MDIYYKEILEIKETILKNIVKTKELLEGLIEEYQSLIIKTGIPPLDGYNPFYYMPDVLKSIKDKVNNLEICITFGSDKDIFFIRSKGSEYIEMMEKIVNDDIADICEAIEIMCDLYDDEEEFVNTLCYFRRGQEDLVSLLKDIKEYNSFVLNSIS